MLKIFKDKRLAYIAAGVSLLLQLISFFTTYQGANYYFRGIIVFAPLLFAIAVQSVVYFLENSIRGRRNFFKVAALVLAMCCSSYFSYIGIYNNVNSPLTYYQTTYNDYRNQLQASYASLIKKAEKDAQKQLNQLTGDLTTIVVEWDTRQSELKDLSAELNSGSSTAVSGLDAPKQSDYPDYESYTKAYSAYVAASADSDAKRENRHARSVLKKYGYSGRQEVVANLAQLRGQQKNMKHAVKELCKFLQVPYSKDIAVSMENIRACISEAMSEGSQDKTITQGIYELVALHEQYKPKQKINADRMIQCIELQHSCQEELMADYKEISDSDPSTCKSKLQWEISKAVTEINRVHTLLQQKTKVKAADYPLEDIYILPILRLVQKDTRKMAMVCLLIAVLTDALSLLFALMFCPEKEILDLKSVDELLDREEPLFEKNIAAALQLTLRQRTGNTGSIHNKMTEQSLQCLADFLEHFETSSVALDSGYSLQASFDELREYQALIALLCQLDLACVLSENDYQEVFEMEEGGLVVLLKTRFLLWCNMQWGMESEEKEALA